MAVNSQSYGLTFDKKSAESPKQYQGPVSYFAVSEREDPPNALLMLVRALRQISHTTPADRN